MVALIVGRARPTQMPLDGIGAGEDAQADVWGRRRPRDPATAGAHSRAAAADRRRPCRAPGVAEADRQDGDAVLVVEGGRGRCRARSAARRRLPVVEGEAGLRAPWCPAPGLTIMRARRTGGPRHHRPRPERQGCGAYGCRARTSRSKRIEIGPWSSMRGRSGHLRAPASPAARLGSGRQAIVGIEGRNFFKASCAVPR